MIELHDVHISSQHHTTVEKLTEAAEDVKAQSLSALVNVKLEGYLPIQNSENERFHQRLLIDAESIHRNVRC